MAGVPYIFGNATTSIPLSQLDQNFNTTATLGNAAIGLGNTTTTVGNLTLANVTILSGTSNIATAGNIAATTLSIGGTALGAGDASIMKNRIINGTMVIDQRNAGAATANTINGYTLDRWAVYQSTAGKVIAQQNAGSVTPPVGFTNYLGVTSQSAYSVGSSDYYIVAQGIEGFNFADLQWGTANAKTVTLSAWVYSSLTGTFGGSLRNGATNYSYPFTYSISVANTWTQISVTVAGPTAGTWIGATNALAMQVNFGMGVGSTLSGTSGSWSANNYLSATGATSVVGTNGATFYITGVQLEVGSSATGFEYRQYQQELALCQRYFYTDKPAAVSVGLCAGLCFTSNAPLYTYRFPVIMRTSPTFTYSALSDFGVVYGGAVSTPTTIGVSAGSVASGRLDITATVTAGQGSILQNATTSAALNFSAEL